MEQHRRASRGHGGAEGMRNPSPAIPGLSVLGTARPGSARGRCWQSESGRRRRGDRSRGCPLALRQSGSFRSHRAGRRSRNATAIFCWSPRPPDSSPGRQGCGAKGAGLGRTEGTHRTSAPTCSSACPHSPWQPGGHTLGFSSPPGPVPCRSHLFAAEGHFWLRDCVRAGLAAPPEPGGHH